MADDPNEARRQEILAQDRELRAKSMEEFNKRTQGVKPTPTQEENDRAALGEHVLDKEPDGSPEVDQLIPDARGAVPHRKQETAKPQGSGRGYETRQVPRSTPSGSST